MPFWLPVLSWRGAAVRRRTSAQARRRPAADDGRYTFHRVDDSFVRLDGRTGQVSVCGREATGWACQAVPDERAALEETIGRLQGDNAALKKELLARGLDAAERGQGRSARAPRTTGKDKPADSPVA